MLRWDAALLFKYYKRRDYYNKDGYYSQVHKKIYYDGYGYNFYNGQYAYYEYSPNPASGIVTPVKWILTVFMVLLIPLSGVMTKRYLLNHVDYNVGAKANLESIRKGKEYCLEEFESGMPKPIYEDNVMRPNTELENQADVTGLPLIAVDGGINALTITNTAEVD